MGGMPMGMINMEGVGDVMPLGGIPPGPLPQVPMPMANGAPCPESISPPPSTFSVLSCCRLFFKVDSAVPLSSLLRRMLIEQCGTISVLDATARPLLLHVQLMFSSAAQECPIFSLRIDAKFVRHQSSRAASPVLPLAERDGCHDAPLVTRDRASMPQAETPQSTNNPPLLSLKRSTPGDAMQVRWSTATRWSSR
jgi:hypothetical protein